MMGRRSALKIRPHEGLISPAMLPTGEVCLRPIRLEAEKRSRSLLAPYGNAQALAVAKELDVKIESLLREAAA
jgi:hypothetical protein